MWITKKQYEDQREWMSGASLQLAALTARNIELEKANTFLQTMLEWLTKRINQLEYLAARLTEKEAGIAMAAPVIGRPMDFEGALNFASDLFEDPAEKIAGEVK